MRISVQWLRERVDTGEDIAALAHALTMAGLEIEANEPAAPALTGVVVAEVLSVERHPDAEKLNVCRVNTGRKQVQIVCGAANVRAGLRAPLAQVGAKLPNGLEIKAAKLRGVESFGMLCSARELGLSEDAAGLMELPADLNVGEDLNTALALDDRVLAVNLTPNRGDCMSMAGVAREVSAVRDVPLREPSIQAVPASIKDALQVKLAANDACSKFAARVIRDVRATAVSPLWLRERLRRAGLRPISAIVDITNYVMLEIGQPMHAYDLKQLHGGITVRLARDEEKLTLLDGREITLTTDVLVIADEERALGLAGVMGGQSSSITDTTTDVLLEVAHFHPDAIAGRGRRYGLVTDASQRFERGVDPQLPERVIERATQLILECAGGAAGPVTLATTVVEAPAAIRLRRGRVQRVLGVDIPADTIAAYLQKLGCKLTGDEKDWQVTPPSWRFDLRIEADLIEEIARLYGYDRIQSVDAMGAQQLGAWTESSVRNERVADAMADRGYQEAITYSFTEASQQKILFPNEKVIELTNPISAELAVMRVSLWPGLARAARDNLHRQQTRIRLFEIGRKFVGTTEIEVLAGIAIGTPVPEQWGTTSNKADFFDIKADVEAALALTSGSFQFEAAINSALHPGQSAKILRDGQIVGWLGALHPSVTKDLDLTYPVFVFELETQLAFAAQVLAFREISIFPAIRRDLAAIVDETITVAALDDAVRSVAGPLLREVNVLSVYRGEQIGNNKKSMALGLNLQDTSRTLTDADADQIMTRVMNHLRQHFGADFRDK
jgi:phenylalanyl-tRNA synthetase beta chain